MPWLLFRNPNTASIPPFLRTRTSENSDKFTEDPS